MNQAIADNIDTLVGLLFADVDAWVDEQISTHELDEECREDLAAEFEDLKDSQVQLAIEAFGMPDLECYLQSIAAEAMSGLVSPEATTIALQRLLAE